MPNSGCGELSRAESTSSLAARRLQKQLQSLFDECHIKLSSVVSDLLGVSAIALFKALAEAETKPAVLFGTEGSKTTTVCVVDDPEV
jgi:hypothetical protein